MKRWYNPARTLIFLAPVVMMASDDSGCSTAKHEALSEAQVRQMLIGNTLEGSGGDTFALLRADGTVTSILRDGNLDHGNWRIDESGQVCARSQESGAKERCGEVKSIGGDEYQWNDKTFKVREGNIKNL